MVIRSFELKNPFSRIAIRSLRQSVLSGSFSQNTIRSIEFDNPQSRIAIIEIEGTITIRENRLSN